MDLQQLCVPSLQKKSVFVAKREEEIEILAIKKATSDWADVAFTD